MTRPVDENYKAWLFSLRVTAEVLLFGNDENQCVYANIAPPDHWQKEAITIWAGTTPGEMLPRLNIGDMDALWVWDGGFASDSPKAQNVWEELWPEAASEPIGATAQRLATHIELPLTEEVSGKPESRFAKWARLFCAAVDCLPFLGTKQRWTVWTSFHGGWGTYYLNFARLERGESAFALSEDGHLAMVPSAVSEALGAFNIRPAIDAGLPREAVSALLLPALNLCAAAAETR